MTSKDVRTLLDDVFEEQALLLGGLLALHPTEAKLVEELVRSLVVVRKHALGRIGSSDRSRRRPPRPQGPDPSIQRFLVQIGRAR